MPNARPPNSNRLELLDVEYGACDVMENFEAIQKLLDVEYGAIQNEIQGLRCQLFSTADEIEDVRRLEPPPTAAIETFTKRLQTREFVLKSMAQSTKTSPVAKLSDSVRLNRLWE
jgi:hypothetical protein